MSHKQIQRKLLLFLDDELTKNEKNKIKQHLKSCATCSKQLETLTELWKLNSRAKTIEPSPFLWTRVAARIKEYETHKRLFSDFFEHVAQLARPGLVLLMLVTGILLGIYIGNVPASSNTQSASVRSLAQERERFFNSLHLDSFRDLPPESVGGVYVTLASNENGGEQ